MCICWYKLGVRCQVSGVGFQNIGLRTEVYQNREGENGCCRFMTENDSSWFQEDDSWRKTTSHVKRSFGRKVFWLSPQHSLLIY
jgi:hypothetical protein